MTDFNTQIIDEFRANEGHLGGGFTGVPVLLLHHKGRRTGVERVNPLAYQRVGDAWAVFASFAGATHHPDWYLNLVAEPHVTIEVGTDTLDVVARDAVGEERDDIWERQKIAAPNFAEYEVKAGERVIPVVLLEQAQ